jgi:hypothetical protein
MELRASVSDRRGVCRTPGFFTDQARPPPSADPDDSPSEGTASFPAAVSAAGASELEGFSTGGVAFAAGDAVLFSVSPFAGDFRVADFVADSETEGVSPSDSAGRVASPFASAGAAGASAAAARAFGASEAGCAGVSAGDEAERSSAVPAVVSPAAATSESADDLAFGLRLTTTRTFFFSAVSPALSAFFLMSVVFGFCLS